MIKELLRLLQPEQKKQLMYAFENEVTQYVKLPGNKFLGVNVGHLSCLVILESAGVWAYGELEE